MTTEYVAATAVDKSDNTNRATAIPNSCTQTIKAGGGEWVTMIATTAGVMGVNTEVTISAGPLISLAVLGNFKCTFAELVSGTETLYLFKKN